MSPDREPPAPLERLFRTGIAEQLTDRTTVFCEGSKQSRPALASEGGRGSSRLLWGSARVRSLRQRQVRRLAATGRGVALASLLVVAACGSVPVDQASVHVRASGLPSGLSGLSTSTARRGWAFTPTEVLHTARGAPSGGSSRQGVTPRFPNGATLQPMTVDFVDGGTAFVAPHPPHAARSALLRSVDAGAQWQQAGIVPASTAEIDFVSATVGWVVVAEPSPTGSSDFVLERTLDGAGAGASCARTRVTRPEGKGFSSR